MKLILGNLILFTVLAWIARPASAQEIPTHGPFRTWAWCKDFTLGARPSDEMKNGDRGYELWMQVPDGGPNGAGKEFRIAPIPLPARKDGTPLLLYLPDGLVSPDARWVAASQKLCRGYTVAHVLQRDEKVGFKPLPKLVSEMGWDKFFEENPDLVAKRGEMTGITSYVEASLCDLVAWEPDSSGVWFSLRGGDRRAAGIYQWYFLWETKTGKVLVPERVKEINRFAAARWTPEDKLLSKEETVAEEQHWVFLADLQQRLANPKRPVPRETLEMEAGAQFDRYRKADRQGTSKGLMHIEARSVIGGQRHALIRASLKEGAVASLEGP